MKYTRRSFIGASAVAASLVTAIEPAAAASSLSEQDRNLLRVAMDEIIPAVDGMPSASEAGGLAYIEALAGREQEIRSQLQTDLARLNDRKFDSLDHASRVSALQAWEKDAPNEFALFRDLVYESYYTQPQIWKLIGYELYPTDRPGPHLPPFDDSILEPVRKKSKLYRDA